MIFCPPKIIGHRGAMSLAPENTICSINKAIKYNVKWIEIDIKISKDHIPFLLHDDTLERTSSGKGNPLNYKYIDILKLDAGLWFGSKYKGLYLPTLKEVLALCSKKNIGVNIELKPNKGFEKENVEAVVKMMKKYNFTCKHYFSSFDWLSSILVKELLPRSFVGILIDTLRKGEIKKILEKCKYYNFFSCGFNKKIISKEIVDICKKYRILINVYSSRQINITEAKQLWRQGVNTIFVNNPKNYKKILK